MHPLLNYILHENSIDNTVRFKINNIFIIDQGMFLAATNLYFDQDN